MQFNPSLQVNIDELIYKLIQSKHLKCSLTEYEVAHIVHTARYYFSREDMLLSISAPLNVCGDIHGQFEDLITIFQKYGDPSSQNYLFLGDYVDRGKQSLEVILLLFCFKIKYPDTFFLLRGNHEDQSINKSYGFYHQCVSKYSYKIFKLFSLCWEWMPVCALINQKIMCMHGGISPSIESLQQINNIKRPTKIPDEGLLCDLLWSDPHPSVKGFQPNDRMVSWLFGKDVFQIFMKAFDLDLLCRAHQVVEKGYQFLFDQRCITIFSAPNYGQDLDNKGAVLVVDENMVCQIHTFGSYRSE